MFLEDQLDGHAMVLPCRRLPDDGAKAWAIVEERGYEGMLAKDPRVQSTLAQRGDRRLYTTATPGPGAFLNVVNDGSDFVEVASSGTVTFTGFGKCERAQSR